MSKRNKIIYWIATVWLSLGMLTTGIVQLIKMEEEVDKMMQLGYPSYLLVVLGISKILGVTAILVPKFPLLKEWAYAGFFFTIAGAIISHLVIGDTIAYPILFLILIAASWYFRPTDRKVYK
ncbi:DoxX-like family protein [Paenibacillus sp. cl141a]|uniref:DoxX family protein n=1 Tax=Paenibacillus sp. cl141a TaxID=1761877 RepID=UPI0008B71D1C|nr:DoxX family protein [Paenibacillus sp. cl141a]SEM69851.1 DoxX-like family protein [Paenibacillus sp. cl141a]